MPQQVIVYAVTQQKNHVESSSTRLALAWLNSLSSRLPIFTNVWMDCVRWVSGCSTALPAFYAAFWFAHLVSLCVRHLSHHRYSLGSCPMNWYRTTFRHLCSQVILAGNSLLIIVVPVNCHFGLVRSDPVPAPIVFPFLSPQLLQQLSEEVMQSFLFVPFARNIMIALV